MNEYDTDDLRRRAESGVPRGAADVWANATGEVRRRRRRNRAGAGVAALVAAVVGFSFVVGGDGSDTEVVSPPTTEPAPSSAESGVQPPAQETTTADAMPDVLLDPPADAVATLESAGLTTEIVVGPFGDGDLVLATEPRPGVAIETGELVSLVVGPVPLGVWESPMRVMLDDLLLWENGGDAYQRVELRKSEMIADCMAARGLPYDVWVQPALVDDAVGVTELARSGWGLVRRMADGSDPVPPFMIEPDPNGVYASSLTGPDLGIYVDALWEEGGCAEQAEAWQSPYNLEQQDLLAAEFAALGAGFAMIDDDPTVRAALDRYFECLTEAHGVAIEVIGTEHLIVVGALESFVERHGEDPGRWSQAAIDELSALERFEHEVAFTVVACVIEHYRPVRDAVAVRVEESMIEEHADFLAALQDVVDRALG